MFSKTQDSSITFYIISLYMHICVSMCRLLCVCVCVCVCMLDMCTCPYVYADNVCEWMDGSTRQPQVSFFSPPSTLLLERDSLIGLNVTQQASLDSQTVPESLLPPQHWNARAYTLLFICILGNQTRSSSSYDRHFTNLAITPALILFWNDDIMDLLS